ncbi:MAG: isoprenyl transferase [Desulfurivibrionaceae bacterium]|nr:isoprenyl transferase [Desulfobulbales bacterium]MDT8334201.1 isoprenyl transferase [Desulfurivibrionaceae bacterium]
MTDSDELDLDNIPSHVAVIMDGNGRWAQKRGLPRPLGHRQGVESVQAIVRAGGELGVKILTLYAFSTENWNRPAAEVQALMGLLKNFLQSELKTITENNVSLRCLGQRERLPDEVGNVLDDAIARTAENSGLILNLALSYGGRNEIVRAIRQIAEKCRQGVLAPEEIDDKLVSAHLDTAGQADPDLLIRTGGESRLSNFLLWQLSYAELYITETLWPDFRKKDFIAALAAFQKRQRRFGKISNQVG